MRTVFYLFVLFAFQIFPAAFLFSQANPQWAYFAGSGGVNAMTLDGDQLWVASYSGIHKINTVTGEKQSWNCANTPGFGAHDSHCLSVDGGGHLWAVSQNMGVMHFDGAGWEVIRDVPGYGAIRNCREVVGLPAAGSAVFMSFLPGSNQYQLIHVQNGDFSILPVPAGYGFSPGSLLCDQQGNLWALLDSLPQSANTKRIARYDWSNWQVFDQPVDKEAWGPDLQADALGNLYLLNNDQLAKFDGNAWTDISGPFIGWNSYGERNPLFIDAQNQVWVAGGRDNPNRIFRYDGNAWTTFNTADLGLSGEYVYNFCRDGNGVWWFTFQNDYINTLQRWDGQNPVQKIDLSTTPGMPDGDIISFDLDFSQEKWVGARNEVARYTDNAWAASAITPPWPDTMRAPYNLTVSSTGMICYSDIWGEYIYTFDDSTVTATPVASYIGEMQFDQDGRLWVVQTYQFGWYEGGDYHPVELEFDHPNFGSMQDPIASVDITSDGSIWAVGVALHHLPPAGSWINLGVVMPDNFDFNNFENLMVDNTGLAWMTNENWELSFFDGQIVHTLPVSGQMFAEDSQHRIWGGTVDEGAFTIAPDGQISWFNISNSGLPLSYCQDIAVDAAGNVWFTTSSGLAVYNENGINGLDFSAPFVGGKIFADLNQNEVSDAGEPGMAYQKVDLSPDGTQIIANAAGEYRRYVQPGNYTVQMPAVPNWALTTDSSEYHIQIGSDAVNDLNFGWHATTDVQAAELSLSGFLPRCSRTVPYFLTVRNTGTLPFTGKARLVIDPAVDFNSAVPPPTTVSGDTLEWEFTDLPLFAHVQIQVYLDLPNASATGNEILLSAQLLAADNAVWEPRDTVRLAQTVQCSFDPNDKTAFPTGPSAGSYSLLEDGLEYVVRFQNTGNDTAFSVRILDRIAPELDLTTFELIDASHPVHVEISPDRVVTFLFEPIFLPDSTTDYTGSQGFVRYGIQAAAGQAAPVIVHNTAAIYFDLNPAVWTNTTENVLVNTLVSTQQPGAPLLLTISPNPSEGRLGLELAAPGLPDAVFTLYNTAGTTVFQHTDGLKSGLNFFNLQQLPSGLYFGQVNAGGKIWSAKWIKQ